MNLLARPVEWVGARPRAVAAGWLLGGSALLAGAAAAWQQTLGVAAAVAACARVASAHAVPLAGCDIVPDLPAALLAPLLALLASGVAATGLACLLRPRGHLHAEGQRLLADAERHHAVGSLSPEGYQATRDRLHAQAEVRSGPQATLALSLWAGALALLAFLLAGGFLAQLRGLGGVALDALPGLRSLLASAGAVTAGALAAAAITLVQAARGRAHGRREATALHTMLRDLEADILDEVARNGAQRPPSP